MKEEWRPVQSLKNVFAVSNMGRVKRIKDGKPWNAKAGKIPKLQTRDDGYIQVSVGGLKLVHYLVCEAFNGPKPTPKHQCNHKDGRRDNNIPSNLEWVTSSENNYHSHRTLGCKTNAKKYKVTSPKGEEQIIINLRQFCVRNNLTNSNMAAVLAGRQSNHKGWKIEYA